MVDDIGKAIHITCFLRAAEIGFNKGQERDQNISLKVGNPADQQTTAKDTGKLNWNRGPTEA